MKDGMEFARECMENIYPIGEAARRKIDQDRKNAMRSLTIKKEGSITMSSAPDQAMTGRQAKNVSIEDAYTRLSIKVSMLEERLENTVNRYQGNPSVLPIDVGKTSEKPPTRPMMHIVDELPGDLGKLGERINNCLDKISMIDEMIL